MRLEIKSASSELMVVSWICQKSFKSWSFLYVCVGFNSKKLIVRLAGKIAMLRACTILKLA
jgi:hypothetical protein